MYKILDIKELQTRRSKACDPYTFQCPMPSGSIPAGRGGLPHPSHSESPIGVRGERLTLRRHAPDSHAVLLAWQALQSTWRLVSLW